jgi:hypothetical protein
MTTETAKANEALRNKIKAHMIEFREDKPGDIAKLFEVPKGVVYDLREQLRRHGMLPRDGRAHLGRKTRRVKVVKSVPNNVVEINSNDDEVARLKAEVTRLKVIVSYLEAKISKAA